MPPAPQKCNLGTLFKKHETKIGKEQEQASGDSTRVMDTEQQRRQQVNTKVQNIYLSARLDFKEDPLRWWKAQPMNYVSQSWKGCTEILVYMCNKLCFRETFQHFWKCCVII